MSIKYRQGLQLKLLPKLHLQLFLNLRTGEKNRLEIIIHDNFSIQERNLVLEVRPTGFHIFSIFVRYI